MIPLIRKTLRDKRWVLLGWVLGLIGMTVLTILFYPSFSDSNAFDELAKSLPPQLQSLIGDAAAYKLLPNYIGQQVFDLRLPLLTIVLAIVMAINLTATEEENGTLKTLQSLPISRGRVLLAKWFSLAIITAVVCAAVIPGVLLAVLLIGRSIDIGPLVGAAWMLWLLTFAVASFTMLLGAGSGKKGLTAGIASMFAFYNIFMSTMAPSVEGLRELYKLTLYYYYNTPKLVVGALQWDHIAVLAVATVVFGLAAVLLYRRRDIENG